MSRRNCVGKPPDWWDLGDDGNRLALALCRSCPARGVCAAQDPSPAGVIRGGVAWTDAGHPAQMCDCGRPIARPRLASNQCLTCDPRHDTPMPTARPGRRAAPGAVERHADTIAELVAAGWTDRAIGVRIGALPASVRGVRRRHQLASRAPQAGPRRRAS